MSSAIRTDVVGFSRGVTSAVTAWLVAQEHPSSAILLFHDAGEEDPDNDRFGAEVAAFIGLPITEDSDGRTVSELFEDEGTLGNGLMTPCSRVLKQQRSLAFCKARVAAGEAVTLYLGFNVGEEDRWTRARQRYDSIGVAVEAPLIRKGWDKETCKRLVRECWGIALPRSYDHYDNANCLGCVKGGLAYWGQVYLHNRDAWERRAAQEDDFGHTVLNSRYGDYPEGGLRAMLPRCLELAAQWRASQAQGVLFPLIEAPCACGS